MTTETLMTDGQHTQAADPQQATTSPTAGDPPAHAQQQATEGQNPEGQQTEGEPAPPEGAPEKYEFKAADGTTFDDAVIGAFESVARDLNLTQGAAQQVLDKMGPVLAARQAEQIEAVRSAWADSARADKEYGGDKLPENLAVAKKALEQFGSPELKTLLHESGLGNNPEVIRFMVRAGKAISEDKIISGKAAPVDAGDARTLYPNSNLK